MAGDMELQPAMVKMKPSQCPSCFSENSINIFYSGHYETSIDNFNEVEGKDRIFTCHCKRCGETFCLDWVSTKDGVIPYPIPKTAMLLEAKLRGIVTLK